MYDYSGLNTWTKDLGYLHAASIEFGSNIAKEKQRQASQLYEKYWVTSLRNPHFARVNRA